AATARLTCFNGDLPSRLPFGDESGDFTLPGGGPIQRIIALLKPTAVIPPLVGKPQLWRLISQLSLNYLSLVEGGAEALQELLRLHNFGDSLAGAKQIQGLLDVRAHPSSARIAGDHGLRCAPGGDPAAHLVHFPARPVISFPPRALHVVDLPENRPARMVVNFMGLVGPLGVLPYNFTLLVAGRARVRDRALRDFLDIFQHR